MRSTRITFRATVRTSALTLAAVISTVAAPTLAHAASTIVEIKAGTDPVAVATSIGATPEMVLTDVTNGFVADLTAGQVQALSANTAVEDIAADGIAGRIDHGQLQVAQDGGFATAGWGNGRGNPGEPPASLPGQPPQFLTAAVRRIGVPASPTAAVDGVDDRRVNADIAVLDGGVDPYHPDLNVAGGHDCLPGPTEERGYYDRDGHGTLVAGFAAAIDNGIGVVGSAPGARIWAIRVADPSGYITDSALLCGLDWVMRHHKTIEVANLSLAGSGEIGPCVQPKRWWRKRFSHVKRDRIHQRICRLVAKDVTVVTAAGNAAIDASTVRPAAYDETIAVSAFADFDGLPGGLAATPPVCFPTEQDDVFATFSNFGAPIDISAPGVCVISTFPNGQYALVEGTSFSTPFVSGAAALLHANHPRIRPERVRTRLLAAAEPGPISGDPDAFAEGVLNVSTF